MASRTVTVRMQSAPPGCQLAVPDDRAQDPGPVVPRTTVPVRTASVRTPGTGRDSLATPIADVEVLLGALVDLDRDALVALAERGRGLPAPPDFRGRCLDPAYVEAVATGAWSPDHESHLRRCRQETEAVVRRVDRRHRRRLRTALSAAALSVLTSHLPQPAWQERREVLSGPWRSVVGPLPHARRPVD